MKTCSSCFVCKADTEFYTNRRKCKSCYFSQQYKWQKDNIDKKRSYTRKSMQKAYKENPQELLDRGFAWRQQNKDWITNYNKQYQLDNPEKVAAIRRLREHSIKQQTPSWANQEAIKSLYKKAKQLSQETGILYTVDHVIPLQGKLVSGLHVENNLQILTKSENSRKNNTYADSNSFGTSYYGSHQNFFLSGCGRSVQEPYVPREGRR